MMGVLYTGRRAGKWGVAALCVVTMVCMLASSAKATTPLQWHTGAFKAEAEDSAPLSGELPLSVSQVSAVSTFTTHILGETIEWQSTGVEAEGLRALNYEVIGAAMTGRLRFTGLSVLRPTGCEIPTTFETTALTFTTEVEGGSVYLKITPTAGENNGFGTMELSGSACPIGTKFIPKGFLRGRFSNGVGTMAQAQEAEVSGFTGSNLRMGREPLAFVGVVSFNAGTTWFGLR